MWPFNQSKTVPIKDIPVDCVFKSIMEALDVSTVEQWEFNWQKRADYLLNKKTGYSIAIEKYHQNARIAGIDSKIFSDDQSYHLYNKAIGMRRAIEKRKNEQILRDEVIVLKRFFPQCFE